MKLEIEEKKKQKKYSFEITDNPRKNCKLGDYERRILIKEDNKAYISFFTSTLTSSCGSVQIKDMEYIGYYANITEIPKEDRIKVLDFILNDYTKINNFYFLDRDLGFLEKFFSDLGFTKVWTYLNRNSENHVHMWCLNKWTDEEVEEIIDRDNEDEDYD